jgi:hypothetical protein
VAIFVAANLFAFWKDPFPLFGTDWRGLRSAMQHLDPQTDILFANAPEAAFFFSGNNYHQYLRITERLRLGEQSLADAEHRSPEWIVVTDELPELSSLLKSYIPAERYGHVTLWHRS